MTPIIRRTGILLWSAATLLATSILATDYIDPDLGRAVLWATPCAVLLLGSMHIADPLRRRLYTGIATAAIFGIGLSYAGLLWTRHQVDRSGVDLYNAYLATHLDRMAPGWHFDDQPWKPEVEVEYGYDQDYRLLLASAYVSNSDSSWVVFGNMRQAGPFTGWREPRFYICPLDSTGAIASPES